MINNLRQSFLDKGIFLKDSWLHSMVDSGLETHDSIFVPLLNSDISETCEKCTLPDITKNPHFKFKEDDQNFNSNQIFLQINEVVDISLPLEQRRALERSDHSTFKIFLTDGVNNFVAISKKPITTFSTDVTPGSKIFIKAPFESRYGIIFLSDENTKFLNGKSDAVINHRKSIYSKIPKQSSQNQKQPNASEHQQPQQNISLPQKGPKKQINKYLNDFSDDDDDEYYSNVDETINRNPKTPVNNSNDQDSDVSIESGLSSLEDSDDIESIDESDFDNLPSNSEKQNKKYSLNNPKMNSNKELHISDYDIDSSDDNVIYLGNDSEKQKNFLDDDDIDFTEPDNNYTFDSNHIFTVEELKSKKNLKQKECFATVKTSADIVECCDFNFIENDKKKYFSMKVILRDHTGKIRVKIDPDTILSIIQLVPDEFIKVDDAKMDEYFTRLNNYFQSLAPPIVLIDRGGPLDERYTIAG